MKRVAQKQRRLSFFIVFSIFIRHKSLLSIYIYIYKENLAKLHKRTINYILEKKNKRKKNYCSGEGLEGNIRTIRASPPKNYNRHLNKEKEKKLKLYLKCKNYNC